MKKRSLIIGLALMAMPLAGCGNDQPKDVKVDSISLSESSLNMVVGDSETLTATVLPDDATDKAVTWSVAPSGVVNVDGGAVTAIAAGECVITAKAGEKEAICNVTVTAQVVPVESITLNVSDVEVEIGATYQLSATVLPANATNKKVTWTSTNETYATVSENGLITAKAITESPIAIKASAGGKEASCSLTVKDIPVNEKYFISEVNQNANIAEYQNNTKAGETEFLGEIERIQVGTDNGFNMKPSLVVYSFEDLQPVDNPSVWTYPYEYKIEELDGATFVDAKATYAEFDSTNASFKFNDSAVGKTLKLSVTPGGLSDTEKAQSRFTKTLEVNVAKGYNVYSAKELAYFDDPTKTGNRWASDYGLSPAKSIEAWTKFRTENGLNPTYVAQNIFLQSNIVLTKADLPAEFFFADGEGGQVGYLRDCTDVYFRENVDTILNGNYFNIDTQQMPLADVDPDFDNVSHASLFKVFDSRAGVQANHVFKNCSYFGNGRRSSDEAPKGGLIFVKFTSTTNVGQGNVKFSNFNMEAATISLFVESYAAVSVESCDIEQGYSNFMYLYQKGMVDIKKSVIKDFGGPAIVGDVNKDIENSFCPIVKIDNDSTVESWCVGEEPWFMSTHANVAVGDVKALDGFYTQGPLSTKTFLKQVDVQDSIPVYALNCIYVSRSSTGSVFGSVSFGDSVKMGVDYNSDSTLQALYNGFAPNVPVLSTDAGGLAIVYADETHTGGIPILTNTFDFAKLAKGEFTNLCSEAGFGNPIYQGNYLHLAMSNAEFGGITLVTSLFDQAA